ncbi:hypothetical protein ANCCAN_10544 [Ancylostoma caninum]|uniref:RNA helicase n=1 Tax=Ancylostoma caninum TaxID=29170 RepID=A0A368GGI9_ANCCA|nr:hypothetical protein ANCCAN_10544 [Ancylostoma caninum]
MIEAARALSQSLPLQKKLTNLMQTATQVAAALTKIVATVVVTVDAFLTVGMASVMAAAYTAVVTIIKAQVDVTLIRGRSTRSQCEEIMVIVRRGRWAGLREDGPPPSRWERQQPRDERLEAELFAGQLSGINFDKYEEIPVEATGDDVPPPISLFSDLKLHPWIEENIQRSGYNRPTPVQKYSIPALMAGRDLMSCAQTGSGKTAAFLVPLINAILQDGPGAQHPPTMSHHGRKKQYPSALVLSPTRELSLQIYNESRKFGYRTPITSALLYGGRENYRDQINKLRLGCHILIATPGRLIDVMEQDYIGLKGCRYLVLDEADRMLDMGFEPQIRQIVDLSTMPGRGERVTAMFSATFPKEIQVCHT